MSVKGRHTRRARHDPVDRWDTADAIVARGRAVGRGHRLSRRAQRAVQAWDLSADAFAREPADTGEAGDVEEEVCARCGVERSVWQGNKGKGYTRHGATYCCHGCAEGFECSCL
jgi:hypothetical protein